MAFSAMLSEIPVMDVLVANRTFFRLHFRKEIAVHRVLILGGFEYLICLNVAFLTL
jgi:hypothetical protein